MSITKTVVGRPTTLIILFSLLVGLGIYAASDLAIDLYPEITPPVLLVFTDYSGAGPEEVEKTITRPLEGALSNVSNVDEINSVSREGGSQVTIQFTWGTDMSEASNEVRDKLEFVKPYLPEEASTPQIFKFDPSMIPILNMVVKGNRSPEELRDLAENIIQPRLEQVEGVAMVSVMGGRDRVIRVEIPQNRLAAYDLTLTQVANMIRGQNVQISAGSITEGNVNYLVRTSGEYRDVEQIRNTVIAYRSPQTSLGATQQTSLGTVRLRDIANVYDGFRKEETTVFINGQPGVYISLQKQSGSNSVQAADNVMSRIEEINRQLPIGTRMEVVFDTTTIIRSSLEQVQQSALLGALLAVVILFVFLRSFKSTLIIGLSIPISVVVTLMLMYFFGLTLNIMTLTGLVLGIGMLVDNSIVILENIYRYREKGSKLRISAILGSQEMLNAIVASTLTTICVFAPIALFRSQLGMMGELFSSLSFTVVISLTASLLVAILLVPVLASRYLPLDSRKQRPISGLPAKIDGGMERFFRGLDNAYRGALRRVLRFRKTTILAVTAAFAGSLFLIPIAGFEFMPNMEEDYVQVSVELPVGTKLEITKALMNQLEHLVREEVDGYKEIIVSAGERSFFGFLGASQSHKGDLTIVLPSYAERIDSSTVIKQKLRRHFNDFPSATFAFAQEGGPGGNASPIDVLVKTEDLELGKETAVRIRDLIEERIPEVTEPTVSLSEGLPQAEIVIDRAKAYALGLNIATIGQEVRANIDGITASQYREGGNEYDILLILAPEDRTSLMDLDRIFVTNSMGRRIPLASFASWEYGTGPVSISRENQTRTLHVTGGLTPGAKLNEVERQVRSLIMSEIPADERIVIDFSGDFADLQEYGFKFIVIMIIAFFLVFGVMASQFESFLDPFIIIFTIPITLIGVILVYVATGEPFSLFTAVGMVMLVGIVVNNGIVLVDYTNLLHRRGMSIRDACVEAGGNRLRPILMTTLTTILGLIPMAFFRGEGTELVAPIGRTVVGGLSVSTLITLFFIPVIYSIFNEFSDKRKMKREAKRIERHERIAARNGRTGSAEGVSV